MSLTIHEDTKYTQNIKQLPRFFFFHSFQDSQSSHAVFLFYSLPKHECYPYHHHRFTLDNIWIFISDLRPQILKDKYRQTSWRKYELRLNLILFVEFYVGREKSHSHHHEHFHKLSVKKDQAYHSETFIQSADYFYSWWKNQRSDRIHEVNICLLTLIFLVN